jgi:phosphoenolpyruvate---glycerone phosphotransferase subunit DhaL
MEELIDNVAARAWVQRFLVVVEEQCEALGDLDRLSGDGDYGDNLQGAILRARAAMHETELDTPGAPFGALSNAFLGSGGTSGPLFGMWFRALARESDERGGLDLDGLTTAATQGLEAVQRLGGAEVGDKTMVDAMSPAVQALRAALGHGSELQDALARAAERAQAGARSTEQMLARRGRASYVGESARGVLDPGALTFALFLSAARSPETQKP